LPCVVVVDGVAIVVAGVVVVVDGAAIVVAGVVVIVDGAVVVVDVTTFFPQPKPHITNIMVETIINSIDLFFKLFIIGMPPM
jgi:hypothetical protein